MNAYSFQVLMTIIPFQRDLLFQKYHLFNQYELPGKYFYNYYDCG